jgi:ZIP family zinc transporter
MIESLKTWFLDLHPVMQGLLATTFTWLLTAAGASLVFFFKDMSRKWMDIMLGFTGGVMIAASFWSLLAPAIEMASDTYGESWAWIPAAVGFTVGALFLFLLDKVLPHLHLNNPLQEAEGPRSDWNRTLLLVMAITLHNIPEGLAVGVAFGAVAQGLPHADLGAAVALAIGIGLQNFPEGLAVAMPLRRNGLSARKSFFWGQLSAVVEPLAGALGAAAVMIAQPILPYALAFAAGAMMFVVVEEVIPETQKDKYADFATLGLISGFVVMMILDVALG